MVEVAEACSRWTQDRSPLVEQLVGGAGVGVDGVGGRWGGVVGVDGWIVGCGKGVIIGPSWSQIYTHEGAHKQTSPIVVPAVCVSFSMSH